VSEHQLLSGDLDARMRGAFAGVDTSPGFEARVAGRIASLHAEPADILRERVERRRMRAAERLRREAWMNAMSVAGIGAAAIALVWRHGPAVARWTEDALAAVSDPGTLTYLALATLTLGLWPVLRGLLPR
jgi:ferric-dicitrate binding protein FerR (iron transport regulator)